MIYFLIYISIVFTLLITLTVINGILYRHEDRFSSTVLGGYGGPSILAVSTLFFIVIPYGVIVSIAWGFYKIFQFIGSGKIAGFYKKISNKLAGFDENNIKCSICSIVYNLGANRTIEDIPYWTKEKEQIFCSRCSDKTINSIKVNGWCECCGHYVEDCNVIENSRGLSITICNECSFDLEKNLRKISLECLE